MQCPGVSVLSTAQLRVSLHLCSYTRQIWGKAESPWRVSSKSTPKIWDWDELSCWDERKKIPFPRQGAIDFSPFWPPNIYLLGPSLITTTLEVRWEKNKTNKINKCLRETLTALSIINTTTHNTKPIIYYYDWNISAFFPVCFLSLLFFCKENNIMGFFMP